MPCVKTPPSPPELARSTAGLWRRRWRTRRAWTTHRWKRRWQSLPLSGGRLRRASVLTACATIHQPMPALIFVSPQPLAGKTTVTIGLARRLRAAGRTPALTRLPGDKDAQADGELFSRLSEATLGAAPPPAHPPPPARDRIDAPPGDPLPSRAAHPDARAIVVGGGPDPLPALVEY